MEAAILAAEDEVVRLEAIFSAPDFYATHASDWQELDVGLGAAREEVARLYARWEELSAIAGPLVPESGGAARSGSSGR
jgi:hypothetical protein